jgi:serine protease Do
VVEVNGKPIRNNRELIDTISYLPVGTEVKITIIRDGKRQTVTAKTEERPPDGEDDEEETSSPSEPVRDKLGLSVQELSSELRRQYGIGEEVRGVIVTYVKNVSPAGEANINEGDVISEVQGQRINNIADFRAAVERIRSGQRVRFYVTTPTRGGQSISTYRIITAP